MNEPISFRPLRRGPEALLQHQVLHNSQLVSVKLSGDASWSGSSVPIGAGFPDIVVASYEPDLLRLTGFEVCTTRILAFLRTTGGTTEESLFDVAAISRRRFQSHLRQLFDAEVINESASRIRLRAVWKRILPEITAIEVKVSNWQTAIRQARRNKVFAHRSMVAVPETLALRIVNETAFKDYGLGLISISQDGKVKTLRNGKRGRPLVWPYYYALAHLIAKSQIKDT